MIVYNVKSHGMDENIIISGVSYSRKSIDINNIRFICLSPQFFGFADGYAMDETMFTHVYFTKFDVDGTISTSHGLVN